MANLAPQQKRAYSFRDCLEQYDSELWMFACVALGECMGLAALAYASSWYVHMCTGYGRCSSSPGIRVVGEWNGRGQLVMNGCIEGILSSPV